MIARDSFKNYQTGKIMSNGKKKMLILTPWSKFWLLNKTEFNQSRLIKLAKSVTLVYEYCCFSTGKIKEKWGLSIFWVY